MKITHWHLRLVNGNSSVIWEQWYLTWTLLERQFIMYPRCLFDHSMFSVKGTTIVAIPDSTLHFLFLYLWALFHQLAETSPFFMPILVPFSKVHLFVYLCTHTHTHTHWQETAKPRSYPSPSSLHKPETACVRTCSSLPAGVSWPAEHSQLWGHASWKCQETKQPSTRASGKLVDKSSSLLALLGG